MVGHNYGLKGKVKTLKFSDYNTTERYGEYQKGDLINSYFIVFDEKGNIIEKQEYNRDGSLFDKYIYKYNNQNHCCPIKV